MLTAEELLAVRLVVREELERHASVSAENKQLRFLLEQRTALLRRIAQIADAHAEHGSAGEVLTLLAKTINEALEKEQPR